MHHILKDMPTQKKKLIIIFIAIILTALLSRALYYFHSEYGIFYSREKRAEVSEELERKSQDFMEKTFPADFPQAEKMARRAIRYNKENIEAYILLARSLYAQEKLEEARDTYLTGLGIESDNFKMNFYLGNVYRDLGEFDLAEECYKKALEIEPQNIECWLNYAIFYSFDRQDWQGAVKIYEEALKVNPDNEKLKGLYETAKQNTQAAD